MIGHIAKNTSIESKKIAEKRFMKRISASIASILICLFGLGFSAYAYFTNTTVASLSIIQTAYYELDIESLESIQEIDNYYMLDNTAGSSSKVYNFNIKKSATATAEVGYCKVEIITDSNAGNGCQTYYIKPIGAFLENNTQVEVLQRTVSVSIPAGKSAKILFNAEWGTYSGTDVVADGETIEPTFATTP